MIKFTELDIIKKMDSLPKELKDKLLFLAYDNSFVSMINYRSVKTQDVINEIDYTTRMTALGFASKQELFDSIGGVAEDEEETRHIFGEIDGTILVPNNLQGSPEETVGEDVEEREGNEDVGVVENIEPKKTDITDKYSDSNITETAEDILKEIENPTSSPLILPIIRPSSENTTPSIVTVAETPKAEVTQPKNNVESQQIPATQVLSQETTNTPVVAPEQNPQNTPSTTTPTPTTTPSKESQLDSKLAEPVVQTAKSTYYKVDPYREQME